MEWPVRRPERKGSQPLSRFLASRRCARLAGIVMVALLAWVLAAGNAMRPHSFVRRLVTHPFPRECT